MLAFFCDKLLGLYGRMPTPHKGRDRLVSFLSRRAQSRWKDVRRMTRRGLRLESDFSVDNTSWILYSYGCLDYYDERAIRKLLKPGSVCFDIGANTGYYSMLFSRWTGPEGRVFGYEPVPYTHGVNLRNLRRNRAANVTTEQAAIGAEVGSVRMCAAPEGHLGWSKVSDSGEVSVRCTTIDAEVQRLGLGRLDFIKMDIQGYELQAFEGAVKTLRRLRPK